MFDFAALLKELADKGEPGLIVLFVLFAYSLARVVLASRPIGKLLVFEQIFVLIAFFTFAIAVLKLLPPA